MQNYREQFQTLSCGCCMGEPDQEQEEEVEEEIALYREEANELHESIKKRNYTIRHTWETLLPRTEHKFWSLFSDMEV